MQDVVQTLLGLLDVPRDLSASRSGLLQGLLKRGVEDTLEEGVKYLNTEEVEAKSSGEVSPAPPPAGSPGASSVDVARVIKRQKVKDEQRVSSEQLMSAKAKLRRFGSLADACLYVGSNGYLSLQEIKELAIHAGVYNPAKASKTALVSALKEIDLAVLQT